MMKAKKGMGWLKDLPDMNDLTQDSARIPNTAKAKGEELSVKAILAKVGATRGPMRAAPLPSSYSLRPWCSPVMDQGDLGSCTAHAAVSLLEYFEIRAFGRYAHGSCQFLYKTTRNLLGWTGDTGAYLRSTMGAMALLGVPQNKFWPYYTPGFDAEPTSFVYCLGQAYKAMTYYRLDPAGAPTSSVLTNIKQHIAAGLPCIFGFACYESLWSAEDGKIPYPVLGEARAGGHAVLAMGYDDDIVINNGTTSTKGALMIKNSWGEEWGGGGYGYLPYEYVLKADADDFWCLINNEFIETGHFDA